MKESGCKKWTGQTMDLAGSVIGVHLISSNYIGMKPLIVTQIENNI